MPQKYLFEHGIGRKPEDFDPKLMFSRADGVPFVVGGGNAKIGQLWTFSLPEGETCPGKSPYCHRVCSVRNRNPGPTVREAFKRNFIATLHPKFADWMVRHLRARQRAPNNKRKIRELLQRSQRYDAFSKKYVLARKVVRLHPSGDFYSEKYIRAWVQVAEILSDWRFFGFTRSWAVPSLAPALRELRNLPNVVLYASVDASMNSPLQQDLLRDWALVAWTGPEQVQKMPRCMQHTALYDEAFAKWRELRGTPTYRKNPGKDILRKVACQFNIKPLFCVDCQHCIRGRGSVWFKELINQYSI